MCFRRALGSSQTSVGAWRGGAFLDAGKPPVYFGFGSICAPEGLSKTMIE
jgi:hypothetical protein